jgi:hypothetical protein
MAECREATLAEILSDPIVLMVMAADGVDPREFELNLREADRTRKSHRGSGEAPRHAAPRGR